MARLLGCCAAAPRGMGGCRCRWLPRYSGAWDGRRTDSLSPCGAQLYRFLARRTDSKFNATILKRLFMSKMNRPPISVSKLTKHVAKLDRKGKEGTGKIICVVGTVTNDERKTTIPAMKICALRFTETARAKIVKAGGECMTFDQLAMAAPTGDGCILLRGRKTAREAQRHFGATGVPGSSVKCVLAPQSLANRGSRHFPARAVSTLIAAFPAQAVCPGEGPQVRAGSWQAEQPWFQGLNATNLNVSPVAVVRTRHSADVP